MQYLNHTYLAERDEDDDVVKLDHKVVLPDGSIKAIPLSPYDEMTEQDFRTWIDIGLPGPDFLFKTGNFFREDFARIRATAEEFNIPLNDTVTLRTVCRMMKAA